MWFKLKMFAFSKIHQTLTISYFHPFFYFLFLINVANLHVREVRICEHYPVVIGFSFESTNTKDAFLFCWRKYLWISHCSQLGRISVFFFFLRQFWLHLSYVWLWQKEKKARTVCLCEKKLKFISNAYADVGKYKAGACINERLWLTFQKLMVRWTKKIGWSYSVHFYCEVLKKSSSTTNGLFSSVWQ